MALTKADIIDSVADHNGYSKKEATDKVETLVEIIKQSLASGEDVLVCGFGKFSGNEKAQRKGRNPAAGDDMMLARGRLSRSNARGS